MATAVITGASSGIGRDIAKNLAERGYDLILCARREELLLNLAKTLSVKTFVFCADLTIDSECKRLYEFSKDKNVEILVNNAGFGLFGEFSETDLSRETEMINLNIKALHTLTKLFLEDFIRENRGYILNVASAAAFLPAGPLLSTYYATKAYVYTLTNSIRYELFRKKSRVQICQLCPGPVKTEFSNVSGVDFMSAGRSSESVAKLAVRKMFRKKGIIIPGFFTKLGFFAVKLLPMRVLMFFAYTFQRSKKK